MDTQLNLKKMAELLKKMSEANTLTSIGDIEQRLSAFLDESGNYSARASLRRSFLVLQHYLFSEHSSPGHQKIIAYKILEGLDTCIAGFHNRIAAIELGLIRPSTISDFLFILRMNIVGQMTYKEPDVHLHNAYYSEAAKQGFGVRPLNSEDRDCAYLTHSEIDNICKEFAHHYTPITIISYLFTAIKSELSLYYDYVGCNHDEVGYQECDYSRFESFLNTVIGKPIGFNRLFIGNLDPENETPCVRDINWVHVRKALITCLDAERYVHFDTQELLFFKHLEQLPSEAFFAKNILLMRRLNLIASPELFSHLPADSFSQVRKLLFAQSPPVTAANYISEQSRRAPWLAMERAEEKMKTISFFWHPFLNKKNNQRTFVEMSRAIPLAVLEELLTHATHQNPDFLQLLLTQSNLPFIAAERHPLILERLVKNEPSAYETNLLLLLRRNKNDATLLIYAAKYEPKNFAYLLTILKNFSIPIIMRLLSHQSVQGSALISIIQNQPQTLALLLAFIETLPMREQIKLMGQTCSAHKTALMHAAQASSEALKQVLDRVATFDKSHQLELLWQKDAGGANVLMMVFDKPFAFLMLVQATTKICSRHELIDYLCQQNKAGQSILMLVLQKPQLTFNYLFDVMKPMTGLEKMKLLTQKNAAGDTPLMLATQHSPEAVERLLGFASADKRLDLIGLKNAKGTTAFLNATATPSVALLLFLRIIMAEPAEKTRPLFDPNKQGDFAFFNMTQHARNDLPAFLSVLQRLSPVENAELLSQPNARGNTPLMMLMMPLNSVEAIHNYLIRTLSTLTTLQQYKLLVQRNNNNETVMLVAARYQPALLFLLLHYVQKFSVGGQRMVLNGYPHRSANVLLIANYYHPEKIGLLLNAASALAPESQKLLVQRAKDGSSVLTSLAHYLPEKITAFLSKFSPQERTRLIFHKDQAGNTPFSYAARYQPTAVEHLLASLGGLSEQGLSELLSARNNADWTAFEYAARYQPEGFIFLQSSVAHLCSDRALSTRLDAQLSAMIKQAFALATHYHPGLLDALLNSRLLAEKVKRKLLVEDYNDHSIFMIAAQFQALSLEVLVKKAVEFSLDVEHLLARQTLDKGETVLMLAARNTSLDFMRTGELSEAVQRKLLLQQDYTNATVLMHALSRLENTKAVFGLIEKLACDACKWIGSQRKDGWSALMLAAETEAQTFHFLLAYIDKYEVKTQRKLLSVRSNTEGGDTLFSIVAKNKSEVSEVWEAAIERLSFVDKYALYNQISGDCRMRAADEIPPYLNFPTLLIEGINQFDTHDPVGKILKTCLCSMLAGEPLKICRVLDAYRHLQQTAAVNNFQQHFLHALHEDNSVFCQAFTQKFKGTAELFFAQPDWIAALKKAAQQWGLPAQILERTPSIAARNTGSH